MFRVVIALHNGYAHMSDNPRGSMSMRNDYTTLEDYESIRFTLCTIEGRTIIRLVSSNEFSQWGQHRQHTSGAMMSEYTL